MTLSIAEAMQQAHEAMNRGDFQSASQTGSTLVRQFPSYARAHGLLGEAYREQGKLREARESFAASLARYQRAPGTYLGLGLIAEDEGTPEHALAFCQVAWELAPEQRQLREPLSRVAMRRYGSDGDLQLSHAALAQMHANASRLRRAVDEYRRALAALPERVDLKLGMAECLWRMGHDAEALRLAREVLEQFPESSAALVMAADIDHRAGNTASADGLLRQLRAVDPDGSIVNDMLATNPRANRAYLEVATAAIPELSDVAVSAPVERPRIAPAPDFDYRPSRAEIPAASIEELEPINFEEFGGEAAALNDGTEAAEAFDFASLGVEGDLTPISIEELGGLPEGFQPISPEEFGGVAADLPSIDTRDLDLDFEIEGLESLNPVQNSTDSAAVDELLALEPIADTGSEAAPFDAGELDFEDFSEDAPATAEAAPQAEAGLDLFEAGSLDFEDFTDTSDLEPFDAGLLAIDDSSAVDEVISATPAAAFDQLDDWELTETSGEPEDALASLAASLQGDVADALTRAGEVVNRDEDVDDSRPPTVAPGGYTTMLQSLGDSGLAPFDPRAREAGSDEEAMPSMEMDDQLLEQSRPPAQPDTADRLTADWDSIDDEILRAMPEGYQPGYTEELRSLDDIGLAPFEIEEQDGDLQGIAPFNPFATDATASPFLQPSVADAEARQEPPATASVEQHEDDDLLGGLEPFSFEEFDSPGAAPASDEQRPPWEMGGSAIPSDEDLDTLLAFEDDLPEAVDVVTSEGYAGVMEDTSPPATAPEQPHDSGEVSAIEREIEADWTRMTADVADERALEPFEQSLAVTRDLSSAAATDESEDTTAADDGESSTVPTSELPGSLRPGTEVFSRAREAKQELVAEGVIGGNRELFVDLATDDLTRAQDIIATRVLERPEHELFRAGDDDHGAIGVGFDSSRDVATLRAEIEINPGNDDLHWYLAEALREQGAMADAYAEYRWLIRNAPQRHDAVLEALLECVDRDLSADLAHRLLGDIYRRRGDVARASSHAALSLQKHRRGVRR